MKIRELFEATAPVARCTFKFVFNTAVESTKLKKIFYEQVKNSVSFGKRIQWVLVEGKNIEISIPTIQPNEYTNRKILDDFYNQLLQVTLEIANKNTRGRIPLEIDETQSDYTVEFHEKPIDPVDCDVVIFFPFFNTDLSNCDKLFGKTKVLLIQNHDKITGRVLSLLKLKGNVFLQSKLEWAQIVQKYLNTPSPDILGCKEELITAGLKEHAKL